MLHVLAGAMVGAVVGAVGTAVGRRIAGKPFDWSSVAAGALGGAATGSIASLTLGAGLLAAPGLAQVGGLAVAGGAGGFSEQVADNLLHDRAWEEGTARSTAFGAALGAGVGAGRMAVRPLASLVRSGGSRAVAGVRGLPSRVQGGSLRAVAGVRRLGGNALRTQRRVWNRSVDVLKHSLKLTYPRRAWVHFVDFLKHSPKLTYPRRGWVRSVDFLKHSPKLTYPRWLVRGYKNALARHPVRTKSLTSGILGGTADLIAQRIQGKEKIDLRRTAFMAAWGLAWGGPAGHFWHRGLERLIPGTAFKSVAGKIALDQFLWTPVNAVLFLGGLSLSEGKSPDERVRDDLGRSLKAGWSFWPGVHVITFRYVPENLRVLWGGTVGLGWGIFYSKFIHDTDDDSPAEGDTDEATPPGVERAERGLPLPTFEKSLGEPRLSSQVDPGHGPTRVHPGGGNTPLEEGALSPQQLLPRDTGGMIEVLSGRG